MEDALLGLARELLSESPAARWDAEWAHGLCKDALARLAKAYAGLPAEEKDALDLSAQDVWDERMCAAGQDNDPAAFRAALKSWEQAGLLAAPLRAFSGENEAKATEPLTQGVFADSWGCHAR